jgi:2-dehydropantoate 2-reductase
MSEPAKFSPLSFLCFGMGAIGTYIGGSLALTGHSITFIDRPEAIAHTKASGLSLTLPKGQYSLQNVAGYSSLSDAMQNGVYDAAMVAVKSFDTSSIIESLQAWKDKFPSLICLQNGVENEAAFEAVLGKGRVIGASITTAVSKKGVGKITVEKMRGIGVESGHPFSTSLINAFDRAGLNAKGYPKRDDMKWSKMLTNLMGNATSAILNWTPGQIFADPNVYWIELQQIRETLSVMKRLQIHLVNLPGTPIRPMIQFMMGTPPVLSRPITYLALGKSRGEKMPSFHIDLYGGQSRSEVDYLNGAVVKFGKQLGINTPVNQGLTEILDELASGKTEKSEYADRPEKLLSRIKDTL